MFPTPSNAQDAVATISETALNFYAGAVGTIQHDEYCPIRVRLPDTCELLMGMYDGDPTGAPDCGWSQPIFLLIAEGTVRWSIQAPRFEISTSGINFHAVVQATFVGESMFGNTSLNESFYRAIKLPASVYFEPSSRKLFLSIVETGIPIEFPIVGASTPVTSVYPWKYYSTNIEFEEATFQFPLPNNTTRTLHAHINLVEIQYLQNKLKLKQYLAFD